MDFERIITDYNLSGLPGMDFLRTIRERRVMAPTVMITGDCIQDGSFDKGILGVIAYLPKPLDFKGL